jgi:pectinesterase
VFDDSELHVIRPGYITAQSRTSPDQPTGYVFRNASITVGDMEGKDFYLGRPWRKFSRVVFLSSEMPASLSPQGWSAWAKGGSIEEAFYGERGSKGAGARLQSRLQGSHQLTEDQAAQFAPKRFLAGSDHWNPIDDAARLP